MKKLTLISGIAIVAIILTIVIVLKSSNSELAVLKEYGSEVQLYKSASCGCCGLYSEYLGKRAKLSVNVVNMNDVSSIKEKYAVPSSVRSCHTLVIGDYFVEGHVPVEAIAKLLTEKPDIAGIALSGMPSGSPGMPGPKQEEWTIYAVNTDGSTYEFMRI